jgi:hypothetical protein
MTVPLSERLLVTQTLLSAAPRLISAFLLYETELLKQLRRLPDETACTIPTIPHSKSLLTDVSS